MRYHVWPRAAKKSGNWHPGIVDAAGRFMTRWHRGEVEKRRLRLAAEDPKKSSNQTKQGKPEGRRGGRAATDTAIIRMYEGERRNEMAYRVARHQFD